ncbi:hypothetical protein ACJRO7_000586 [Eucalyptus globulus]|uniref:Cysteine-rich transmembrane CYSTM domain-containing protein n=1 Tax=Eucalyptus globulus TaxID=34317 RepID=A0ABD3LN33_EUCGL
MIRAQSNLPYILVYPPPMSTMAYVAPPPPGYPIRDGQQPTQNAVPIETKTRCGASTLLRVLCCGLQCCCEMQG